MKKDTFYDIVKVKLENFPEFRERKARGKYLAKLALRRIGLERNFENDIPLNIHQLSDFAITYDSFRHAWGDVTRDIPELRGNDYGDGEMLEQEAQIRMGYEVGYNEDVKKLSKLK